MYLHALKKDSIYRYIFAVYFRIHSTHLPHARFGYFFASPGPAGFLASRRALLSPKLHSFAAVRDLDVSKNCWMCRKSAWNLFIRKKVDAKFRKGPKSAFVFQMFVVILPFRGSLLRHVVMIPVSYG